MSHSTAKLVVAVGSFSYRKGYPTDQSGHGGGFVFDCRCITNPGRLDEYKPKTGKDAEVKAYLNNLPETDEFFESIAAIVQKAVTKYLDRGFEYLSIQFGCTGGQHRSIYFAERMAAHLEKNEQLIVKLSHREFL